MTKRKVTIVLDGNTRKIDNAIHQLQKFQQEASAEPELFASLQTEDIDESDYTGGFDSATNHD